MVCRDWQERLIAHLYGELEPDESSAVESHLARCDGCRKEAADLAEVRACLAAASPELPAVTPRVWVLSRPSGPRPLLTFAAGFAAAALLLAGGLAAGWYLAGGATGRDARGPQPAQVAEAAPRESSGDDDLRPLTARELEQLLGEYRARVERVDRTNAQLLDSIRTRPVVHRDEFQDQLSEFGKQMDRQRLVQLESLWRQFVELQLRTESRIDETQEAVRLLFLSGDPRVTEQ